MNIHVVSGNFDSKSVTTRKVRIKDILLDRTSLLIPLFVHIWWFEMPFFKNFLVCFLAKVILLIFSKLSSLKNLCQDIGDFAATAKSILMKEVHALVPYSDCFFFFWQIRQQKWSPWPQIGWTDLGESPKSQSDIYSTVYREFFAWV